MANIDFTGIEHQIEDLAKTLFKDFVDQAREDGWQFLNDSKQTFLERTGQFERGSSDALVHKLAKKQSLRRPYRLADVFS